MKYLIQNTHQWLQRPYNKDPDADLPAYYVQAFSALIICAALIVGSVYIVEKQLFYASMAMLEVLVHSTVIILVRRRKLAIASNLFLVAALSLLSFGIFVAGGIHASTSLIYPVILLFASLLLDRKSYIMYSLLTVISIGFIIFAENQGITLVPYVPDSPGLALFLTYALIVITAGIIIRLITENLQNTTLKARQYADEIYAQKTMLDRVGQAAVSCLLDNTIIYWNQAACDLYGWSMEEAIGRKFDELLPAQMNSEVLEAIRGTLRSGDVWSGEMKVQKRDREILHIHGIISPLHSETGMLTGWIATATDLSERSHAEVELRQREAILEAVAFAAEQFLKTADWRENINDVLERLGKNIRATHAYIFEDHIDPQGEPVTSMRYEWTAPGYASDLDGPYFQNSRIHQAGYEEQVEALGRGEVRAGSSSTFNPIEKESMDALGVKALLEVPIFANGKEWGAIGFDDFEQERVWSNAEVGALKIAAGILSAAIQRQEAESAHRESERIYRQAIEAAGAVPYYQLYNVDKYQFMGDGIRNILGYEPDEMTSSLWGRIVQEYEFIGGLKGMKTDEVIKLSRSGELDFWKCDYRILARDGTSKWVADTAIELFNEADMSYASMGILQDITERKQIESNLRKRESLLKLIAFTAEQFLKVPDWRVIIDMVLERLGNELNVSHAYLFERHQGLNGELLSSMRNEWTAPGFKSDLDGDAFQNMVPTDTGYKRYYETLDSGAPLVGSSSVFTESEKEYWNSLGVKALLEIRIIVGNRQWGVLGFDDVVAEREWLPMEVDVIKAAANVLGAAIKRQLDEAALQKELDERKRTEQALRFSEEKFSKAFQATQVLMTIEDDEHLFIDVNKAFETAFGFTRSQIIGHSALELNIFLTPEDAVLLRENLRQNDGNIKDYEMPFRRANGETGVVLLSSEKIDLDNVEYTLTSGLDITERKRSEIAIRESEARYRALFEQSHDAVFIMDLHGKYITANQRASEMLGYTLEEIQQLSVSDISAEYSASERIMERLLAGEHIPTFERLFRKKDGEIFPVEVNVELVRDDKGRLIHVQGVARDVTGRKQTEMQIQRQAVRAEALASLSQTLTQTNQNYHLMLETVVRRCAELIGDGASIFSFSPESEYLELVAVYNPDPAAVEIFTNEMIKYPIKWNEGAYAKVIGERQPVLIPVISIEKLIENASPERREYYQKLPLYSLMLAPLHGQGRILGVIGMARHSAGKSYTPEDLTFLQDIADRSALAMITAQYYGELERELVERKRAEQKYRDIYDNSIDGIFQTTEDGRLLSANSAMARIYGYDSPEDMLSSVNNVAVQIYVDRRQRDEVRQRLNAGEKLAGYETLEYRKDGTTFWSAMNAQAIFDEHGRVLYYEGTVDDITLRKKAEADREALIHELANKNAELEQFTYTVSHDLKSPLVTINGFLGYLEQDAASGNMERLKKDAQRIYEAVQKMQRLLNELLELSRIGRMMNTPESHSFHDLVQEAMEIVHGRLVERKINVQVQANLPIVYGDGPRLIEVVQNLLDNAAKYMGEQTDPRIEIGQHGHANDMPIFFVKDNGLGIAPEYHERIFGLFNKLDPKSEGTGVGLALIKRIIEFHGGRIWVESEEAKGSTFYFTLPEKGEAP